MSDDILTTAELAKRLNRNPSTIWRWQCADPAWAKCVVRRTKVSTYWSVKRLVAAGFLNQEPAAAPALSYSMRIAQ